MKDYCPNCMKESELDLIHETIEIDVRGEKIEIKVEYYRCQECGEGFEIPRKDYDPLEIAYRIYRERKGMVQPEQIREFRNKYGLTQKEFSDLLGIGVASLSRYENGALQDEAHDRLLKLSMKKRNLFELIKEGYSVLSEDKRRELINKLEQQEITANVWLETTLELYGNYDPDLYSGFKRFNAEKFFQATKFFCYPSGVVKTKLTKLLFYADFLHFKDYSVSITGSKYAHLPYGPVPDNYKKWFSVLIEADPTFYEEEVWWQDYQGEQLISRSSPDLSIFSTSEIKILATIKEEFKDYTAVQIKEFAHDEKAYIETKDAELISYSYADELQI